MSTLIAKHNNGDLADVDLKFHGKDAYRIRKSEPVFFVVRWLGFTSCLSGFQHQVQEQRGEDERYRTNHQHRVITSCQSSGYKIVCVS
jgi:hypothetical protein